jgi:F420-dependent oxidoreductase-like protein
MEDMVRLAMSLGYWGRSQPQGVLEMVLAAERLGYERVLTAEAWGSDAFSPLAWYGANTTTIGLGTAVAQISARTPAATAMTALTLDWLSGGRMVLGLGVSGPQVVEGWYGQPFESPLQRTREYVEVVRQVLRRDAPVQLSGRHTQIPYRGPGATGLGKALKSITHPLRSDLQIWLGAEGPRNVALAAEIADGWIALYFAPAYASRYREWLDVGFARRLMPPGNFTVCARCDIVIAEDPAPCRAAIKRSLALYIGGMGSESTNFHRRLFESIGYRAEAAEIRRLYAAGRVVEAAEEVTDALVDEVSIIGSHSYVREQVRRWEDAGVDLLVVPAQAPDELARIAEAVLG